jgi:gliding motility-associated-like protein
MFKKILILGIAFLISNGMFAQRGKHGAKTISSTGTIVNEYTNLTADALSGSNSLTVALSSLNISNRFSVALQPGDLIMIIQVQGTTIDYSTNSSAWGAILNLNNCGFYEFAEVLSVPNATTINISCPLANNYSAAGKVQVVRVPRYASLIINNGGELTADTWNGIKGGIVAIEVLGDATISSGGKIDISGKGFRGGILAEDLADWGIGDWVLPTGNYGAEKGEGIAGFETDYDALGGRYCKAAPANGGGGANAHNAGGGGGANAGDIIQWTGKGNPDNSIANWITAWNLEGTNFAYATSTGGGRGGYTFSSSNQNALVIGPHEVSGVTSWSGDNRCNNGGWGGRPLDYSTGRVFFGGGGGSGDQNDGWGGSGGNGGGLIYLLGYGNVSGAGQVIANGANGVNSTSGDGLFTSGADGAGGGGAGGAIVLNVSGTISGISASANGGSGGKQVIGYNTAQAEGPGGGGGGGYIATSNGTITKTVNGGANGTTNSSGLTEFTPNGATRGGAGINNGVTSTFAVITQNDTICSGLSATLNASLAGVVPAGTTITWYDAAVGGTIIGTGNSFTTPVLSTTTTYYVGSCPGTYHAAVTVVVSVPVAEAGPNASICSGGSVLLNGSGGVTYQWSPALSLNDASIQGPLASPVGTTTYYLTVTNAFGCQALDSVKVTAGVLIANAGTDTAVCNGNSVNLIASGGTNYQWSPAASLSNNSISNPVASPLNTTSYIVTVSDGASCSDIDTVIVIVHPSVLAYAGTTDTICPGSSLQLNASGGTSYQWSPVTDLSNAGIFNPVASPNVTTTYVVTVNDSYGCSATDDIIIQVIQMVHSDFLLNSACMNDTTNFTDNSTLINSTISSWQWDFGDGTTTSQLENPDHLYTNPGSYNVSLTVVTANGCTDSITKSLNIYPVPIATFNLVGAPDCSPASVYFSDNSLGTNSWTWDFGDGNVSNMQNPNHIFINAGNFSVTHIVSTSNGCSDTVNQQIIVYPQPDALFTPSLTTVIAGNSVSFYNQSTGANSYLWNFGDGNTSMLQSPSYTYNTPGTYNVFLVVSDANGCIDSISVSLIVVLDVQLTIPNVFTPNGDNFNDFFVITNLEKIPKNHLLIYNRWGKPVFEKDSYSNDWNGSEVSDGVYYYILTYLDKEVHGTITIER